MLRTLGILFLVLGVLAVVVSFVFTIQHWQGRRYVSAVAPLLGGLGAVCLMVSGRQRKAQREREGFRGDNF